MEEDSFRAVGVEERQSFDPLNVFWKIGLLQFPLVLVIAASLGLSITVFGGLSLLVLFYSIVAFWVSILSVARDPKEYEVYFARKNDSDEGVGVSYVSTGDGKRKGPYAVKKVALAPGNGIYKTVWMGRWFEKVPVKGTNASLSIRFKSPKLFLSLGFRDPDEMNRAYARFKEAGTRWTQAIS
ncbi:MAG TPA: hypothetical protein VE955_07600 [Candidatus Dormibacteraeota bacterium]|nr:hypothetical protein [Candidatus Dormibacteraeota bacterium]